MQQTLIADMLDVSAIVAGKLRLDLRPVSVAETMHAAADAARAAADARKINLSIIVESDATILADSNRLHQVFWNLLSNAVKFTPPEGKVTATIRRTNGKVEVRVEDTGRGIPRAFLPHVFDRFRQQSSGDMGGLGLGLAIVRHLTERHGGNVWADSRGEGQGATFTVTLPVPSSDKPAEER
jgi:signal transduction histidine kinase